MPKPECLKDWAGTHKLSYQDGNCSPFCHVMRPENPDGTRTICGARFQLVQNATGGAALIGECYLKQDLAGDEAGPTDAVPAEPDELTPSKEYL